MTALMPLRPVPSLDIPGTCFYVDEKRNRYRLQFTKDGRRKTISLGTHYHKAYSDAVRMAEDFHAGRIDPFTQEVKAISVQKAIGRYEKATKDLRDATKAQRKVVLKMFAAKHGTRAVRSLDLEDCTTFYARKKSDATKRAYHNVLSTWLRWCVQKGIIRKSPMKGAIRPQVPKGLPAYFTPAQFQKLIKAVRADVLMQQATLSGAARRTGIDDLPDLFLLAVQTGLRRGEILHLRWVDTDLRTGMVHVRAYHDKERGVRFRPKDTDARVVPLSPDAYALLEARSRARTDEDDTALVFPSWKKGGVREGRALSRTFKRYVRKANLPDTLHFHSLRHTFASWHASGGTPIVVLQKWMGHSRIEQTMVYAELLPSALAWRENRFFSMGAELTAENPTATRQERTSEQENEEVRNDETRQNQPGIGQN